MKNLRLHLIAASVALAASMLLASAASAQQSSAAVSGQVAPTDKVTIRNIETGLSREAPLQEDGRFQVRRLPNGMYEVTVKHADGSPDTVTQVRLRAGITTRIN